jgi:integrase/recombinase XerD
VGSFTLLAFFPRGIETARQLAPMYHPRRSSTLPPRPATSGGEALPTPQPRRTRKSNDELVSDFTRWLGLQGFSKSSKSCYSRVAGEFCGVIRSQKLRATTENDVLHYLALVAARALSAAYVARSLTALRTFFRFLYLGGVVQSMPPISVRWWQSTVRWLPHSLSEKQIERLIRGARSERDRALLELAYATGCRTGELSRIRLQDMDFRRRTIKIEAGRNPRVVMFSASAERALRAYVKKRRSGYLFSNCGPLQKGCLGRTIYGAWLGRYMRYPCDGRKPWCTAVYLGNHISRAQAKARFEQLKPKLSMRRPVRDEPLRPDTIAKIIADCARRARLGHVRPIEIRHSFAIHMLERGADVRHVQELLGHTTVESTLAYTRSAICGVRRGYRQFHPRFSVEERST